MSSRVIDVIRRRYEKADGLRLFHESEERFCKSAIRSVTRRAAVLVPLFVFSSSSRREGQEDGDISDIRVWLTRRAQNLRQGGDICLPGGVEENEDASLVDTAVREAGEEMGIARSQIEIVGPLPGLVVERGDRSGNVFTSITPVLAVVIDDTFEPRLNPAEVASAFHLPILRFLSDAFHSTRPWTLRRRNDRNDIPMREHCFEDDVTEQKRGEGRVVTWGFTSRVLIACACVLSDERPAFHMDEMKVDRGPFDYFDEWLRLAEEKFDDGRSDVSDYGGTSKRKDSKL